MRLLLVLTLLVASCGKDDSGDSSGVTPWTDAQYNEADQGCIDEADETATVPQAFKYCDCMLENAKTRWDYDYFVANTNVCLSDMIKDGTKAACDEVAGVD